MAVNTIALAEVFQRTLDAHMNQRAATGFMVDNASQVEYNGGNKIKIPKMTLSGLGNYLSLGSMLFGIQHIMLYTPEFEHSAEQLRYLY